MAAFDHEARRKAAHRFEIVNGHDDAAPAIFARTLANHIEPPTLTETLGNDADLLVHCSKERLASDNGVGELLLGGGARRVQRERHRRTPRSRVNEPRVRLRPPRSRPRTLSTSP